MRVRAARVERGVTPDDRERLIQELTTRAIASVREVPNDPTSPEIPQIFPSPDALDADLRSGRQLTAYLGIDPTAPDLHVGHVSQLRKLRRLQRLGHQVFLLVGDFTGMIGDPTDRSAARVKLTRDQVLANAAGYRQQASKVLRFEGPNAARLVYNSKWLGKLGAAGLLELASEITVAQMLERKKFKERLAEGKPLGVHEFIYPALQGYDSVAIVPGGIDIEIGGSDQIFNMLVGSDMVRRHHGKTKHVIGGALLVDPDGRKIGKTEGNMVTMTDPPATMFHKIMLWGDNITPHALELCTDMPMGVIEGIRQDLASGALSGPEGKKILARTIVAELHGADAVAGAEHQYNQLAQGGATPDAALFAKAEVHVGDSIVDVLVNSGLTPSRREAARLLRQGGIYVNGAQIDENWTVPPEGELVLRRGKKLAENHRTLERTA
jgi:tyrosyl-tRNA synthetase